MHETIIASSGEEREHTFSAVLDFRVAEEKALNGLLIASARPSLLGGLGGLANVTVTSYETMLLDKEKYGAIFRILDGVQVDEDHLANEDLQSSGPRHDNTGKCSVRQPSRGKGRAGAAVRFG